MRLRNIKGAKEIVEASPYVVSDPAENRGLWSRAFQNENPVFIEAGMGKGRFLIEMAQKYPERNFVGLERYESVMIRAVQKLERLDFMFAQGELLAGRGSFSGGGSSVGESSSMGEYSSADASNLVERQQFRRSIPNILLICEDAFRLPELFAPGECAGIYLNFSDPWPKKRYAKHRLTSARFLNCYDKILTPGGCVEFKTDNEQLFDFSLAEARTAGWTIKTCTRDLHADATLSADNVMTEYEEKFSAMGHPIFKMKIVHERAASA